MIFKRFIFIISLATIVFIKAYSQRIMENIGRGAVATTTSSGNFVSWRLLMQEYDRDISFNIYKKGKRLNETPLKVTCYNDVSEDFGLYVIKAIRNGIEYEHSDTAKSLNDGYLEIPLTNGNSYIQHAWPGDLDGDGEYDFVLSRLPIDSGTPVIEAYLHNGKFLWKTDMGPKSLSKAQGNGANDAPPASISGFGNVAGYRDNDNVTVFDVDQDGKAEVFVKTASGVTFQDGSVITSTSTGDQYISVIDGFSGKENARLALPEDFINDGPLSGHFGIAFLDGQHPNLITKFKNRQGAKRGNFNLLIAAYDYSNLKLKMRWKWLHSGEANATSFHQLRIIDVNGDGKDDICDGSYVIKHDGTFLYGIEQSVHGDRFFITDMDPGRPGLEGYGIQQEENGIFNKYPWFYYDAANGNLIRTGAKPADVGRGSVADIDPGYKGYEMWSSEGLFNVSGNKISEEMPVANFKIWWDGDLLGEILDKTNIYKWNYVENKMDSLFSNSEIRCTFRNAPPFYGDIMGDWREEVLWEKSDHSAFRIYTTTIPTKYGFYTLAQNPAYRLCLTVKGYYQSNLVDYYLGDGMENPPKPNIKIEGKKKP